MRGLRGSRQFVRGYSKCCRQSVPSTACRGHSPRVGQREAEDSPQLAGFAQQGRFDHGRGSCRKRMIRESTPSPPPTGVPSLRMMAVGPPSTEEPQAAFEVLEPSEVERIRVEELHHQPEVSEAQLTQACALRKAGALYTPDVEGLLAKLDEEGKPLEVVHTVELKEVRENLAKWFPSAFKERENLVNSKKAFRVMKKYELPPGTRLVPGKGVFTVKHGKGYRRKTRFVACGNYIPADEIGDLYAAGADATTLRAILAYAAGKPWVAGTTDIGKHLCSLPGKVSPWLLCPPK